MPTLVKVSSTQEQCGYCSHDLTSDDIKKNYSKTCLICKQERVIKPTCAVKIAGKRGPHTSGKSKRNVARMSKSVFDKTPIEFYCKLCQEECFYCKKIHTSKYLSMFYIQH